MSYAAGFVVRAVSIRARPALEQQPRARDAAHQLVIRMAPARGRARTPAGALADLDLSALPFHCRPPLATFVCKQSPARGVDRPVRGRDHVAAVATVAILA